MRFCATKGFVEKLKVKKVNGNENECLCNETGSLLRKQNTYIQVHQHDQTDEDEQSPKFTASLRR